MTLKETSGSAVSELGDAIGKTHQSNVRFEITRQHENLCNLQTLPVGNQKSAAAVGIPSGFYLCKIALLLYQCFDHIFNHYDIQQIQDAKLLNKLKIIQL